MSHDRAQPPPKDPTTELEDQLVEQAAEPWSKVLDPAERDGMRIFLNLFVKTHPVMRSMVDRRVKEEAANKAGAAATAPNAAAPNASGVVTRETEPASADTGAHSATDGSGIVTKGSANEHRPKGRAGGQP